jgi:hypothetical protein
MITANKVQEIFRGGRLCVQDKPLFCADCDERLLAAYEQKHSTASVKETREAHQ